MRKARTISLRNSGRAMTAVLAFLFTFSILVVVVSRVYLIPQLEAFKTATPEQKKKMSATATLVMSILLVILFVGLMLSFRPARLFVSRPNPPRIRTNYIDAWAEAGKRMSEKKSPADEDNDDEPPGEEI